MTRKNLISLIILDAVVMVLAAGLVAYRYTTLRCLPVTIVPQEAKAAPAATPNPEPQAQKSEREARAAESPEPTASAPAANRNISFTYKNSKAKKVEIIGDFTDWIPKKMVKTAAHTWKFSLAIAPGEYAYNYVIDGKPKRDPNNPRICNAGRGFPNSFLKIKPLANENTKPK